MNNHLLRRWLWPVVNAIGIVVFLELASATWIEPEVADVPGASGGDAFVWFVRALPVFLVFSLLNSAWLIGSIPKSSRRWTSPVMPLVAIVVWVAAFLYDNAHHRT